MRRFILPILALTAFGCDPESPFYGEDAPPVVRDAQPGEDAGPTPDAAPIAPGWPPADAPGGPPAAVQWVNLLEDGPIDIRLDGWVAAGGLRFGHATPVAGIGTLAARLAVMPADGTPADVLVDIDADIEPGRHTLLVATGSARAPVVHGVALADPPPPGEPGTVQVLNLARRSGIDSVWSPRELAVPLGTLSAPLPVPFGEMLIELSGDPLGGPMHIAVAAGQTAALIIGELDDGRPVARLVHPDGSGDGFGAHGLVRVVDLMPGEAARAVMADAVVLQTAEPFAASPTTPLPPRSYRIAAAAGGDAALRARAGVHHAAVVFDGADGATTVVLPSGVHDRAKTRASLPIMSALPGASAVVIETLAQGDAPSEVVEVALDTGETARVDLPIWSWGRVRVEREGAELDFGVVPLDDGFPGVLLLAQDPDGRPVFGSIERHDSLRWSVAQRDRGQVRIISTDPATTRVRVPDGPDPFHTTWVSASRSHRVYGGDMPAGLWAFDLRRGDVDVGSWTFDVPVGQRTSIFVRHRDDGPSVVPVTEPGDAAVGIVFVNQHDAPVALMLDGRRVQVPVDGVQRVPDGRDRLDVDTDGDGVADLFLPAAASHVGSLSLVYTGPDALPGAWQVFGHSRPERVYGVGVVARLQVVGLPYDPDDARALNITVGGREQRLWMRAAHGPLDWRYGADRAQTVPAGSAPVDVVLDDGQRCEARVDIAPDLPNVLLVRYGDVGCTIELVPFEDEASRLYNGLVDDDVALAIGRGQNDGERILGRLTVGPGEVSDSYPAGDDVWIGADFDGDGQIDVQGPIFPIQWGGLTLALADADTWMLLTVMAGGHPISFHTDRP